MQILIPDKHMVMENAVTIYFELFLQDYEFRKIWTATDQCDFYAR